MVPKVGDAVRSAEGIYLGRINEIELGAEGQSIGVFVERYEFFGRTTRLPLAWIASYDGATIELTVGRDSISLDGSIHWVDLTEDDDEPAAGQQRIHPNWFR
jgi:hypothetical protein